METHDRSSKADRRGIVLILALGMLTMFTVVAITLAAIAKSEATAASNFKRVEQFGTLKLDVAPDEIDDLFRVAMNQLIYDTRNTSSAIRGHSLLRDMYGSPEKYAFDPSQNPPIRIENTGAELRFRKADDARLKGFFGANFNQNYDYQGVYNGTGIFLPKKMDLSAVAGGSPDSLRRLTNAEIALQTAFQTVPSSFGAHVATQLPVAQAGWATLFAPYLPNGTGGPTAVGNNMRFLYPRFPINYQVFDQFIPNGLPGTGRPLTQPNRDGSDIAPEVFFSSTGPPLDDIATTGFDERTIGKHWLGFDEDYDYPDINNMFLAMERADGTILIPSFHRPGLVGQVARGVYQLATNSVLSTKAEIDAAHRLPWLPANSPISNPSSPIIPFAGDVLRGLVLRPRAADHDIAVMSGGRVLSKAGRFKELSDVNGDGLPDDLDASGAIGDSPMELDVDTDGDGKKDAIWVDLGAPVMTVGNTSFKPMYAFKVLDLDGKLNLNVHGNMVRVPQSGGGTVSYPLQHTSHLGASVTEINPMHAMILGDIPTDPNLPPKPIYSFQDGVTPLSSPYKRLLLGEQRITPAAPGRWSPPGESLVASDNGPGRSVPGDLANSDDNQNTAFDHSEGDGSLIPTQGGSGLPAVMGRYGLIDPIGVGRRYSPFSETARNNAGTFGLTPGEPNFLPGLLNHVETTTGLYGARIEGLRDGSANTSMTPGGLQANFVGTDEAYEFNAYTANNTADSPFNAAELARLIRDNDIDTSVQNNRLALLNPQQWQSRQPDISSAAGATPNYLARELYAQRRMRRMFTHESWDLIRYNAPPTTSFLSLAGPALPNDAMSLFSRGIAVQPSNKVGLLPPYLHALANKHAGSIGYSKFLSDLLQIGDIKREIDTLVGGLPSQFADPVRNYLLALESLRTRTTVKGDPQDFVLPLEVQSGRRFDLNRPLSSYTSTNHVLVDLERESFAQQIYVLLYLSSGAFGQDSSSIAPMRVRIGQARVLAQLAVNIVDYIDPDNVMTTMRFDPDLSNGWNVDVAQSLDLATAVVLDVAGPGQGNDGGIGAGGDAKVARSVMTVFGFELPELVINEGMSVVAEEMVQTDPNDPQKKDRYEHTWLFAELMCPWPNYRDPLDNQDGLALSVPDPAGGTVPKSIYVLGVHDQHDQQASQSLDVTDLSQLSTSASTGVPNAGAGTFAPRFVRFNNENVDAMYPPTVGNLPRVPMRVDGNTGYYMVGPQGTDNLKSYTFDLLPQAMWIKPVDAGNQGDNDYTANGFYYQRKVEKNAAQPPDVELKLYRLRNPFAPFNADTNPYIVIDYLRMKAENRALSGRYWQRQTDGQLATSEKTITGVAAGAYYAPDPTETTQPPNFGNVVPSINATDRYSLQRKQPWHGYNSEWTPYGRNKEHPLYGNYLGDESSGEMYYEGLFLGLPSLADNGFIRADNPDRPHSEDQKGAGETEHQENAMEQSGFAPDTGANSRQVTFKQGQRKNSNAVAFNTWLSFPFLNRQLATPLELLSVRLYGTHGWFLPASTTIGQQGAFANVADVASARLEWRLRFTDDFEFAVHAWRPSPGTSGIPRDESKYERVWRDRHVPWYLDSRLAFPNWGSGNRSQIGLADLQDVALSGGSDFTKIGDKLRTHSGPQFLAPFPHLYRFFEFVECRSRMNNKDLPATTAWAQRDDRTPGKINLNTITEEEQYKGVVDSISAIYVDPLIVLSFLSSQTIDINSLANSAYWPTGYAAGMITPLGEFPAIGGTPGVRDIASKLVPWNNLALSFNKTSSLTWGVRDLNGTLIPEDQPPIVLYSGFETLAAELWGSFFGVLSSELSNPTQSPDPLTLLGALRPADATPPGVILDAKKVPSVIDPSAGGLSPINPGYLASPDVQWPGIIHGPDIVGPEFSFPGTDPNSQVSSEMYRMFLLSRAGADGVVGTGDDKPFRSYASDDVSDTILRPRNSKSLDFVNNASIDATLLVPPPSGGAPPIQGIIAAALSSNPDGQVGSIAEFFATTFTDGIDDVLPTTNLSLGDYIVRLGGQFTPRLFDPIPDPYTENEDLLRLHAATPAGDGKRIPDMTDDANTSESLDYWMLESRRNELLAKVSGNVTTRSHVFAVWVTVGLFRVEPGTEDLRIPLLGAEVGSEKGQPVRHRAFFIVDRSKAKAYDPEDIDANYELPQIQSKGIIEYYKILE